MEKPSPGPAQLADHQFEQALAALGADVRRLLARDGPAAPALQRSAVRLLLCLCSAADNLDQNILVELTGVGALMKPCRTLYVGSLLKAEYADPMALEEALWRNFGEWGEVENINLISRLSIAFVRYRYRAHAEFAFMAMANNHLDHGENLNVRWAHDDPNPVAHDAAARADADALVEMLKAKGAAVDGAGVGGSW